MQQLPESIRQLIKSKVMVGSNSPTARLIFDGLIGGYSEPTFQGITHYIRKGHGLSIYYGSGNIVERADGKFLVAYTSETEKKAYLSIIDNEQALFYTDDNATANEWPVYNFYSSSFGHSRRHAILLKRNDGKILLFLMEGGVENTPNTGKVLCYISENGLGTDFTLLSSVYDVTQTKYYSGIFRNCLGVPLQLDSGVILLPFTHLKRYDSNYSFSAGFVARSTDGGNTWQTVTIYGSSSIDSACVRGIAKFSNGRIAAQYTYNGSNIKFWICYSDDEGLTWTTLPQAPMTNGEFLQWQYTSFFAGNDGYNYMLYYDGTTSIKYYIYRSSQNRVLPSDISAYDLGAIGSGALWEGPLYPNLLGNAGYDIVQLLPSGNIAVQGTAVFQGSSYYIIGGEREVINTAIPVKSVKIDREQSAMAQRLSAEIANVNPGDLKDAGYYTPYRNGENGKSKNEYYQILLPGRGVTCEMGYGSNLVQVFKGQVDDADFKAEGSGEFSANLECRDDGWMLIDKTITNGSAYYLTYTQQTAEAIVSDLLLRAGVAGENIEIENTGMTVKEITFERCTYADAIEQMLNISGFELFIDEYGKFKFYYPTERQPKVEPFTVTLSGTSPVNITGEAGRGKAPIVTQSLVVTSNDGTVTYTKDVDYAVTQGSQTEQATLTRIEGGSITDGATVKVTYVYAAWVFREGEDIFRLSLHVTRRDIYGKVVVRSSVPQEQEGGEGTVLSAEYVYTNRALYGIPNDKVLFVDAEGLTTQAEVQAAANQIGYDMTRGVIVGEFACVPVFHLQVGDCIQIIESSTTISEIYRIVAMGMEVNADGTAMMKITAKHYYFAPIS